MELELVSGWREFKLPVNLRSQQHDHRVVKMAEQFGKQRGNMATALQTAWPPLCKKTRCVCVCVLCMQLCFPEAKSFFCVCVFFLSVKHWWRSWRMISSLCSARMQSMCMRSYATESQVPKLLHTFSTTDMMQQLGLGSSSPLPSLRISVSLFTSGGIWGVFLAWSWRNSQRI